MWDGISCTKFNLGTFNILWIMQYNILSESETILVLNGKYHKAYCCKPELNRFMDSNTNGTASKFKASSLQTAAFRSIFKLWVLTLFVTKNTYSFWYSTRPHSHSLRTFFRLLAVVHIWDSKLTLWATMSVFIHLISSCINLSRFGVLSCGKYK